MRHGGHVKHVVTSEHYHGTAIQSSRTQDADMRVVRCHMPRERLRDVPCSRALEGRDGWGCVVRVAPRSTHLASDGDVPLQGNNNIRVDICHVNICHVNISKVNRCQVNRCQVNICQVNICQVNRCQVNRCQVNTKHERKVTTGYGINVAKLPAHAIAAHAPEGCCRCLGRSRTGSGTVACWSPLAPCTPRPGTPHPSCRT